MHLQQGRCSVASAVPCTQTELAGAVHQGDARCGVAAEVAVVDIADAYDSLQVLQQSHLVLGEEGEGVHCPEGEVVAFVRLVDIFSSGRQFVPIAKTKDALNCSIIIVGTFSKLSTAWAHGIK